MMTATEERLSERCQMLRIERDAARAELRMQRAHVDKIQRVRAIWKRVSFLKGKKIVKLLNFLRHTVNCPGWSETTDNGPTRRVTCFSCVEVHNLLGESEAGGAAK